MTDLQDPTLATRIHKSFNGLFIGVYLSAIFYGLTTYQTIVYFDKASGDPVILRLLVIAIWVFNTLHTVFGAIGIIDTVGEFLSEPGNFAGDKLPWTLGITYWIMLLTAVIVRWFYCMRIWRLSDKHTLLTLVAVLSSIGPPAGAFYFNIKMIGESWIEDLDMTAPMLGIIGCLCVADLIISGIVCVLLWRKRSGIKRTMSVIKTLIGYTVTTGLLTSIIALAGLILTLVFKRTMVYAGVINVLGNVYSNALLASLNRRERIRTEMHPETDIISIPVQTGMRPARKERSAIIFAPPEFPNTRASMSIKPEDMS